VAVSLARLLSKDHSTVIADCDVEEPNAGNLLSCSLEELTVVRVPLPKIDEDKCSHCEVCARTCRYNALAVLKDRVMVFPELCNGCGACALVCPEGAVSYSGRKMGVVSEGKNGDLRIIEGRLDLGQAKAVPIIDAVKEEIVEDIFSILLQEVHALSWKP
jgi:MinD superfamily P-loop ATPase